MRATNRCGLIPLVLRESERIVYEPHDGQRVGASPVGCRPESSELWKRLWE